MSKYPNKVKGYLEESEESEDIMYIFGIFAT